MTRSFNTITGLWTRNVMKGSEGRCQCPRKPGRQGWISQDDDTKSSEYQEGNKIQGDQQPSKEFI